MLWVLPKYEYMPIKKAMNFCKLISTYEKKNIYHSKYLYPLHQGE